MAVNRRFVGPAATKPVKSDIPEVEELSRQVCEIQRINNPFARGVVLEFNQTGSPGTVQIKHKLGRKPEGWILLRVTSGIPVAVTELENTATDQVLILQSQGPCAGKVLVF